MRKLTLAEKLEWKQRWADRIGEQGNYRKSDLGGTAIFNPRKVEEDTKEDMDLGTFIICVAVSFALGMFIGVWFMGKIILAN